MNKGMARLILGIWSMTSIVIAFTRFIWDQSLFWVFARTLDIYIFWGFIASLAFFGSLFDKWADKRIILDD